MANLLAPAVRLFGPLDSDVTTQCKAIIEGLWFEILSPRDLIAEMDHWQRVFLGRLAPICPRTNQGIPRV